MLEIPHKELNRDTLTALIESFVLREGTDYGENEVSLEKKVNDIFLQVRAGELVILFSPEDDSFNIVSKQELPNYLNN